MKNLLGYLINVQLRQLPFFYVVYKKKIKADEIKVIGMIRERNESELLLDTLDHLSGLVDAIVVFDDDSDDGSAELAFNHPAVVRVIKNKNWKKKNRAWEETANRQKLYSAAKRYRPDWFFYSDADERFEGNIGAYLKNSCPSDVNGIKISLLDSYMTGDDRKPYEAGRKLMNFRKYFGPERRDILMIWRNLPGVRFARIDAREPQNIRGRVIRKFFCQHYGKSLSEEQWEQTCDYYIRYFPKYKEKWMDRKGKAIHERSDFGEKLLTWEDAKLNSRRIG